MLKVPKLPKLSGIGKERLKRGLLLVVGSGVILAGGKLLASKKAISLAKIPLGQKEIAELGESILGKAQGILERRNQQEGGEGKERAEEEKEEGQVAGVVQEAVKDPQAAVEKIVESKTKEIIETIKKLPEEQAEKIRKQIMKEICEEVCRIE